MAAPLDLDFGTSENAGDGTPLREAMQRVQEAVNAKADTADLVDAISSVTITLTAAATIARLKVVAVDAAGHAAIPSAADTSWYGRVRGVAITSAISGAPVTVRLDGAIDPPDPAWATWTHASGVAAAVGDAVYLGAAGTLVLDPPTSGLIQRIARVVAPGRLSVDLGEPSILSPDTTVVGDSVFFAIAAGRGLTPDTVRQDQFRAALEASGAGRVDVLIGRILPGHNPVRNAWEAPFVSPGGVLATCVASTDGLNLSPAAMAAIFAAARTITSL